MQFHAQLNYTELEKYSEHRPPPKWLLSNSILPVFWVIISAIWTVFFMSADIMSSLWGHWGPREQILLQNYKAQRHFF